MIDSTTYYGSLAILTAIIVMLLVHILPSLKRSKEGKEPETIEIDEQQTQHRKEKIEQEIVKHDIPPVSMSSIDDPNDEPSYKKIRKWKRQI